MSGGVSGVYHGRGWTVEVGEDAQAVAVLVAEIHEALHDRLQMTTLHGSVIDLIARSSDVGAADRAAALQRSSTRTHEQFATWMSVVPTKWPVEDLQRTFPLYVRHLYTAAARVADVKGDYLRLHAVQGAARAAMQPAGLVDVVEARGLERLTAADLTKAMRPDFRLTRLDGLLRDAGWGPFESLNAVSDLSPERFADENDAQWGELNQAAYEWCADLLRAEGLPTLEYDGHVPFVRELGSGVVAHSGVEMKSSLVALRSVESETTVLGPRLPVQLLPPGTDPRDLMAGDEERPHLFLAIRPRQSVLEQYQLDDHQVRDEPHLAFSRCQRDDGVIELLDVTDVPATELAATAPIVVSIAQSSLADEGTFQRWEPLLGQERAAVLVDLRPSVQLPHWLAGNTRTLRYAMFGVGTTAGQVDVFAFRIEDGGSMSRVFLAPLPRLYGAGLRLWFAEDETMVGRTIEDSSLADLALVRFTVAHLFLEERAFDFKAGDNDVH